MSNTNNTLWFESIHDDFQELLQKKWWKSAHRLVQEVQEYGFDNEAGELRRELIAAQAKQFTPQHETSQELRDAEESFIRNASER